MTPHEEYGRCFIIVLKAWAQQQTTCCDSIGTRFYGEQARVTLQISLCFSNTQGKRKRGKPRNYWRRTAEQDPRQSRWIERWNAIKNLGSGQMQKTCRCHIKLCVKFLVDNGTNTAFPFMSNSLFAAWRLFCFQNKSL